MNGLDEYCENHCKPGSRRLKKTKDCILIPCEEIPEDKGRMRIYIDRRRNCRVRIIYISKI